MISSSTLYLSTQRTTAVLTNTAGVVGLTHLFSWVAPSLTAASMTLPLVGLSIPLFSFALGTAATAAMVGRYMNQRWQIYHSHEVEGFVLAKWLHYSMGMTARNPVIEGLKEGVLSSSLLHPLMWFVQRTRLWERNMLHMGGLSRKQYFQLRRATEELNRD